MENAFATQGLHKIELGVYEKNKAALKCYQKNGFQIEGKLREHMLIDDQYEDLLRMGIINSEFQSK